MNKRTKIALVLIALYLLPSIAMLVGKFANRSLPNNVPTALEQYNERVRGSLHRDAEELDLFSDGRRAVRRFAG